jgi:hypothetical protein
VKIAHASFIPRECTKSDSRFDALTFCLGGVKNCTVKQAAIDTTKICSNRDKSEILSSYIHWPLPSKEKYHTKKLDAH